MTNKKHDQETQEGYMDRSYWALKPLSDPDEAPEQAAQEIRNTFRNQLG